MTVHLNVKGFPMCMRNIGANAPRKERGFLTKVISAVTCKQCKYVTTRRVQRDITLSQYPYLLESKKHDKANGET